MNFSDHQGNWDKYLEALHNRFAQDFVRSKPLLYGKPVGCKRYPIVKGKEATFWHCISEGEAESERTPDFRRCERIGWMRPIVEHAHEVIAWRQSRGREGVRVLLALPDFSYVVVLAERGGKTGPNYHMLWTAFHTYEHRKEVLKKEANKSPLTIPKS